MTALFERILEADVGIRPQVAMTPLDVSPALSAALGCQVLLKCEHLQPTGSFKVRGSANKIPMLDDAARRAGVITASTGNHGQGVARAGALGVAVAGLIKSAAAYPRRKVAAIVCGRNIALEKFLRAVAGESAKLI